MIAPGFYESLWPNYPKIVEAILFRLNYYWAELLYKPLYEKDPQAALNRIMVFDTDAGSGESIVEYMSNVGQINVEYPFTLYRPGITSPAEQSSNLIAIGGTSYAYCPELGKEIFSFPVDMEIAYIHFFNNAPDSRTALTLLAAEASSLTRLYVPVMIGSIDATIAVNLDIEISQGDYFAKHNDYDSFGRIWDISCLVTAHFFEHWLAEPESQDIEKLIVNAGSLQDVITILELFVENTFPSNDATEVPLNSPITIDLNSEFDFSTLRYKIEPDIVARTAVVGKQIIIEPIIDLAAKTKYEVTIQQGLRNHKGAFLQEPYTFQFFTK